MGILSALRLIRRGQITQQEAKEIIFKELAGLEPYIWHDAASGSIYIKFKDEALRSLRIADHKGIRKYNYKWNITDVDEAGVKVTQGIRRFFFPLTREGVFAFIGRIRQYKSTIDRGRLAEKFGVKKENEVPAEWEEVQPERRLLNP